MVSILDKFGWGETVLHKSNKWVPLLVISAHSKHQQRLLYVSDRQDAKLEIPVGQITPQREFLYLSHKALDRRGWKDRMWRKEDSNNFKPDTKASHLPLPQARIGRNVELNTDP